MSTSPDTCAHLNRTDGQCTECGQCIHDIILNGACFRCGTTEIDGNAISPKQAPVIPAAALVRTKPRS